MVAQEFVLDPSSSIQIAFQGRVIAHAKSPDANPKLQGRSNSVTVYETIHGQLIAEISFFTNAAQELDFCLVEQAVCLEDIPDLLACQEPTEHIDRRHLKEQNSGDKDRFLKAFYHDYDLISLEIEKQLREFIPSVSATPVVAEQQQKKSGWVGWNPFGSDKPHS